MLQLVQRAKAVGLDAICITDHESNAWGSQATEMSQRFAIPIFVGVELLTHEGDLLVFGLNELPAGKLPAAELTALVELAGGVCIAAHPFRDNDRGMGLYEPGLLRTNGVEAYNGNTTPADNQRAGVVGNKLKLPLFGGSDAHDLAQIGKYATKFPGKIDTMDEFIRAVRASDAAPVQFKNGRFVEIKNDEFD